MSLPLLYVVALWSLSAALAFGSASTARALEVEITQLEKGGEVVAVSCPLIVCSFSIELRIGEFRRSMVLQTVTRFGGVFVSILAGDRHLDFGGQPFVYVPAGRSRAGEQTVTIYEPLPSRSEQDPLFHNPVITVPKTVLTRVRIRARENTFGDHIEN